MSKIHLFNLLVAIALVITLALTVREALAITLITSQTDAVTRCQALPSRHSIHTEVVNGISVPHSEAGPTGIDGGLAELMTAYRICTK
jgi:hypothetical protein